MRLFLSFLILLFLFGESCKNAPAEAPGLTTEASTKNQDSVYSQVPTTIPLQTADTLLLLFKKERLFEIRVGQKLLKSFSCPNSMLERLPIGTFSVSEINNDYLLINYPNDYYAAKKQSLASLWDSDARLKLNEVCYKNCISSINNVNQVWIFPNDVRPSFNFDPCLGCPHWMAEVYSALQLRLASVAVSSQQ